MSTFMDIELVKYLCSCGKKFPICRLYLCRHCSKLRCIDCVQHEVDNAYCPSCLEYMPAAEAKHKRNRCSNCFDCPLCGHTLMTRATSSVVANSQPATGDEQAKATTKKMYYMACAFCRWTTRDVSLPDQTVATGSWPELEDPSQKRITSLLENYRMIAMAEKAERERKKYVKRQTQLYAQDKYGISAASMKRKSLPNTANQNAPAELEPSVPIDGFEPLSDDYFTQEVSLDKMTTLASRLNLIEFQPEENGKLHPIHKHLLMRKSLRCKECEHNLSKPDFNPVSIKFKLLLTAVHHIPEVRILTPHTFTHNKETVVSLTLSNPSTFNTTVCFSPIEDETDIDYCSAKVDLPKKNIMLAVRDETSMHVNVVSQPPQDFKDDPKIIIFRRANKVGFIVKVTPLVKSGDVKICFLMKHEYRCNTVPTLQGEAKEPEVTWLEHRVYMTLGKI